MSSSLQSPLPSLIVTATAEAEANAAPINTSDSNTNESSFINSGEIISSTTPSSLKQIRIDTDTTKPKLSPRAALVNFLKARATTDNNKRTHTSFGPCLGVHGPWHIPQEHRDQLHELVARYYAQLPKQRQEYLTLIELKPSGKWVFFMDIDCDDTTPYIKQHFDEFFDACTTETVKTLQEAFQPSEVVQLDIHRKSNDPRRVHVYCKSHRFIVNANSATALRNVIISRIKASNTSFPEHEIIKTVDVVMTNNTGFRMYGARKPKDAGDYVQDSVPVCFDSLKAYSIQVNTSDAVTELSPQFTQLLVPSAKIKKTAPRTVSNPISQSNNHSRGDDSDNTSADSSYKYEVEDQDIKNWAQINNVPLQFTHGNHLVPPNFIDCFVCKRKHESQNGVLYKIGDNIYYKCFRAYELKQSLSFVCVHTLQKPSSDQPTSESKNNENNGVVADDFKDIHAALKLKGWAARPSSYEKVTPGANIVTILLSNKNTAKYVCPRTNAEHLSNCGKITFNRAIGEMELKCANKECDECDYPWPTQPMSPTSLCADSLFNLVHKHKLLNQCDLAQQIASEAKTVAAFDKDNCKWRVFDCQRGTWAQSTPTVAAQTVRECLKQSLLSLKEKCLSHALTLPTGDARSMATNLARNMEHFVAQSGKKKFMDDFRSMFESHLVVAKDQWESHFMGYLPVANVILHFDTVNGSVIPLKYTPQMYVRQEYQAPMVWTSGNLSDFTENHGALLLDSLLNDWWTDSERKSWLQLMAYGISRTAFAEKFFVIEGRPGSAKSSAIKLLKAFFGQSNVLSRPPSLLVQKNPKAAQRDDDGSGHDSATMACFDKAFVFLKEADQGSVWRQGKLKDLTGDDQSGRAAHSPETQSFARSFLLALVSNVVPRPADPTDGGFFRRIVWITTTRVFITDDSHKQRVVQQMSPEQIETSKFITADANVLQNVLQNDSCRSYFLALLAQAWKTLIVDQKKTFYTSPEAQLRLEQYCRNVEEEQDSVVAFCNRCVKVHSNAITPKRLLFQAYNDWFKAEKLQNGVSGESVSDTVFFRKVKEHFQHASAFGEARPSVPNIDGIKEADDTLMLVDWESATFKSERPSCFKGIYVVDDVARFLSSQSLPDSATPSNMWTSFQKWLEKPENTENRIVSSSDWTAFPLQIKCLIPLCAVELNDKGALTQFKNLKGGFLQK